MTQMQRHLDLRFHAQEERARPITSRSSTDWTDWRNPPRLKRENGSALNASSSRCSATWPCTTCVEDYIRGQSVVEAKLDGLAMKIETRSCGAYWMENNMQIDLARSRRESLRWLILLTLNNARPIGAFEGPILSVAQSEYPDATPLELRRELDYLSDRDLVKLEKRPDGKWFADLTRYGTDVAEYTIDCEPGIARPVKYW